MPRTSKTTSTVRCLVAVITSATIAMAIHAETLPNPGLLDARIRIASYSPDEVYRLQGYVGYQTDLQFDTGEAFVGLAAGDIEGISFVAEANHLFVKPKAATVGTNLTILTTRHTYQLDYSASARRPDATAEVIYALRFTYPFERAKEPDPFGEPSKKALEASRPRNIDYWYCGSPAIKPVAASDDGVHTRLRFAAHAEQPAIFVRNDDGTESLLNFSMEEGDVILHRIAQRLIVRRGMLTGCIVNKGFLGAGERLKSHTISPEVERATREPRP
jgi:type IV secretion system protein VirB9